jgi:hypothetical protein
MILETARDRRRLAIFVTSEQLAVLRAMMIPSPPAAGFVSRARKTADGYRLSGTADDFEDLVGWVAGEANHENRRPRRAQLLNEVADKIEAVLPHGF